MAFKTAVSAEIDIVALTPELRTACGGKLSIEISSGNHGRASATVLSSPQI